MTLTPYKEVNSYEIKVLLLIAVSLALLTGCASRPSEQQIKEATLRKQHSAEEIVRIKRNWNQLKVGMTSTEVDSLVGYGEYADGWGFESGKMPDGTTFHIASFKYDYEVVRFAYDANDKLLGYDTNDGKLSKVYHIPRPTSGFGYLKPKTSY